MTKCRMCGDEFESEGRRMCCSWECKQAYKLATLRKKYPEIQYRWTYNGGSEFIHIDRRVDRFVK